MEPTDALQSIEVALRLAIKQVFLRSDWLDAQGAPDRNKLEERKAEEVKRRDGVVVSDDLIDYTETYHLTNIVRKNWEQFGPVFENKQRTLAFLSVVDDVRNSIAHSRQLVPFGRDLISGIAGMLRNQVSMYRSSVDQSARYYPLIESVRDNFGMELGHRLGAMTPQSPNRLEVGDLPTFTASAFNAQSKTVRWKLLVQNRNTSALLGPDKKDIAEGDSVVFNYKVTEDDIGETLRVSVWIVVDSQYHRFENHDDSRSVIYAVNPPDD